VAVECRARDARILELLAAIDHADTSAAIACERAFLAVLDGSCRTPIAGHAGVVGGDIAFDGVVLSRDGAESYETSLSGPAIDAERIGRAAGEELIRKAPRPFLQALGIGG
jgi:hydroxymethylbilane synthase